MKVKALALAAGVSTPLILVGSAPAGFTGISTASKPNAFGIFVVNVYATFDRPGEDEMVAVAGTTDNPLSIRVEGGTFFQHPMGTDRAPLGALIDISPDLRYDTFVSIGVKQVGPSADGNPGQPFDNLTLTPGWPGFGPSNLELTNAGWALTPNSPQRDPFDPEWFPGDGRLLIGQFSTESGTRISGTMLLQSFSNGVSEQAVVTFDHSIPCPWDLDGNGDVGIEDFLALLAAWGTDPGGPPDFDRDGDVGITDFLELFANWGPCSFFVDCNGNGVWDFIDVQDGTSLDCNGNGLPDECDIADGTSRDVDGNGVPDECPPPNDDCENAQMISAGATPFTTIGATTDGSLQACDGGGLFSHNDVWFRWTADCTGEATFSTCNDADFDTRISVYFDGPCTPITAIACSDNADGCGLTSELTLVVAESITYLVRIGSPLPDGVGTGTLTITCEPLGQR